MANWDNIEASGNVEDRRRSNGMMLGGGVGLAGIAVFLALNFLGIQLDPALVNTIIGSIESSQSTTPSAEFEGQDSYETFASCLVRQLEIFCWHAAPIHEKPSHHARGADHSRGAREQTDQQFDRLRFGHACQSYSFAVL